MNTESNKPTVQQGLQFATKKKYFRFLTKKKKEKKKKIDQFVNPKTNR